MNEEKKSWVRALQQRFKAVYHRLKGSPRHGYSSFPPGHFSSPIPDIQEILARQEGLFDQRVSVIPGLDLRDQQQVELLQALSSYYAELPFPAAATGSTRYHYENDFFSYGDAIILFSMLRHFRPRRVLEIGAGFSSALLLDTSELFFGEALELTFVEPNPERLLSLLKNPAEAKPHLIQKRIQDTDLSIVDSLQENDLLFVDSSHVLKVGSDVGHIIFQILPRLRRGVLIHFHDIPWPFEYPREWLVRGIIWNEAYILRAFLQYNSAFQILYFNAYMDSLHRELLGQSMPLCLQNPGGSLWLKKVG
jgi:predicted O-methyltransferase YrrM